MSILPKHLEEIQTFFSCLLIKCPSSSKILAIVIDYVLIMIMTFRAIEI